MYPRFSNNEAKHRDHKRRIEAEIIVDIVGHHLAQRKLTNNKRILDCGSGNGYQSSLLRRLGLYFAVDLQLKNENYHKGSILVRGAIERAPFDAKCFDVVAANHVVEHLSDLSGALIELKRIGKPDCLFALSVPTRLWLIVSVPAYYWSLIRSKCDLITLGRVTPQTHQFTKSLEQQRPSGSVTSVSRWLQVLRPKGHGVYRKWGECFSEFGLNKWRKVFSTHGFKIVEQRGLVLYGPSEFPIVPTMRLGRLGFLASSYLFVLQKVRKDAD